MIKSCQGYYVLIHSFAVRTVAGGCLLPMSEPFLSNKNIIERYLPEDASVQSFEFNTCSGSNCFDYAPEGKALHQCNRI